MQLRTSMSGWIKDYEQDRKATSDTLSEILFQLWTDRILTSLERAMDAYHKQCLQYKLQLRTLESSRLTREILSSSDLSKIRSKAGKNNNRMLSHQLCQNPATMDRRQPFGLPGYYTIIFARNLHFVPAKILSSSNE